MLTSIQIRSNLLSQDPQVQGDASKRLGYMRPHVELVAIASALNIDCSVDDERRLTVDLACRLIEATRNHLSMWDWMTPNARIDVWGKASDVAHAATAWWAMEGVDDQLTEQLQRLSDDLRRLRADLEGKPQPGAVVAFSRALCDAIFEVAVGRRGAKVLKA